MVVSSSIVVISSVVSVKLVEISVAYSYTVHDGVVSDLILVDIYKLLREVYVLLT